MVQTLIGLTEMEGRPFMRVGLDLEIEPRDDDVADDYRQQGSHRSDFNSDVSEYIFRDHHSEVTRFSVSSTFLLKRLESFPTHPLPFGSLALLGPDLPELAACQMAHCH